MKVMKLTTFEDELLIFIRLDHITGFYKAKKPGTILNLLSGANIHVREGYEYVFKTLKCESV